MDFGRKNGYSCKDLYLIIPAKEIAIATREVNDPISLNEMLDINRSISISRLSRLKSALLEC